MNAVVLRRAGVDVDSAPVSGVVTKGATRAGIGVGGCDLARRMAAREALNRSAAGRYRLLDGLWADRQRGCALTSPLKW